MREGERVTPLELFFDLVFVLALTQCTALMAHEPDVGRPRAGAARARRAVVVVGRLRVADERRRPRGGRGAARDVRRDGGAARRRAVRAGGVRRRRRCCSRCAYGVVRVAHIVLFVLASRDDAGAAPLGARASRSARRSASACSSRRRSPTARCRARCGRSRSCSTWAGRYLFGAEGWQLVPGHFAERHGLIVIIALGESIVAIGVGAAARRRRRRSSSAAVLGVAVAAALWWALLRRRRARRRAPAVERADGARAQRDRARLLLLPALPDGRGHRAGRARAEEDARARRRAARRSCRRSRCSAARRSTCSRTSRSAGATCTASAAQRLVCALVLRRAVPARRRRMPALATLAILAAVLIVADRLRGACASPSCATACATSSRASRCPSRSPRPSPSQPASRPRRVERGRPVKPSAIVPVDRTD